MLLVYLKSRKEATGRGTNEQEQSVKGVEDREVDGSKFRQVMVKTFGLYSVCFSHSVLSDSWRAHRLYSLPAHRLQPSRLLFPWSSPGKNTGVGCHCLLQGNFLTRGSNLGLLHCNSNEMESCWREAQNDMTYGSLKMNHKSHKWKQGHCRGVFASDHLKLVWQQVELEKNGRIQDTSKRQS